MDSLTIGTQRLIHLDLKGAPLKLSFFERFFPFIKNIGATGILLEWEDTFPYRGELSQIGGLSNSAQASGAPYTVDEAKQLLELANDSDLTIIPLIQTFGHMEYVLKHDQWRGLREVENYPSSMCPSNSETMSLVRSMIKQIVAFHTNIQYLHIGADEVWHMGICPTCSKRMQTGTYGKAGIYLDHVTEVTQFIKDNYPNLKIIIWDDMFRNIDLFVLRDYNIGNMVEPMVWHYNSLENFQLGGNLWEKYSSVFKNIWCASAFKGATTSCQIIPINKYHMSNQDAWLRELGQHAGKVTTFRGIALTGWSRYDHYATLCELLPSSIPTLCLCLNTWLSGGSSQENCSSVYKSLGFSENNLPNMDSSIVRSGSLQQLTFPGWQIYVGFEKFTNVRTRYRNIIDSDQLNTWLNQWQIVNNYTNPMQIDTILPVISDVLAELTSLENYLKGHLEQLYYPHTIEELIGTLIIPMKQHLKQLKADCETQLSLGCRVRGQKRLVL